MYQSQSFRAWGLAPILGLAREASVREIHMGAWLEKMIHGHRLSMLRQMWWVRLENLADVGARLRESLADAGAWPKREMQAQGVGAVSDVVGSTGEPVKKANARARPEKELAKAGARSKKVGME